jgi:hypothetical protein
MSSLTIFSFFRNYSFDVRGRAFSKALYWSDTNAFGPRAYFLTVSRPATLSVDNVQLDDEGVSWNFIHACKRESGRERKCYLHISHTCICRIFDFHSNSLSAILRKCTSIPFSSVTGVSLSC